MIPNRGALPTQLRDAMQAEMADLVHPSWITVERAQRIIDRIEADGDVLILGRIQWSDDD